MGFTKWFRHKFRNVRRDPRNRVHQDIKCTVQRLDKNEFHEAWVCDISKTGIGFLIRSSECDIGEKVIAHLNHGSIRIQSATGQIVGQDIVYYGLRKTVENSFVRYSVHFEAPLAENQLEQLQHLGPVPKN